MDAAIAALSGALIGAVAACVVAYLNTKTQRDVQNAQREAAKDAWNREKILEAYLNCFHAWGPNVSLRDNPYNVSLEREKWGSIFFALYRNKDSEKYQETLEKWRSGALTSEDFFSLAKEDETINIRHPKTTKTV